jgi:hypothetical protein
VRKVIFKKYLKGLLFCILFLVFCRVGFSQPKCPLPPGVIFVPANKIDIVLTPKVTFNWKNPAHGYFTYQWSLYSKPDSQQKVAFFTVEFISDKAVPINSSIMFPHDWAPSPSPSVDMKLCPTCNDPNNNETWFAFTSIPVNWNGPVDFLPPGHTASPFGFKDNGLPGIVRTWTQGNAPIPVVPEGVMDLHCLPDSWSPRDSIILKTPGPDTLPTGLTLEQLLSRLIHLKEQAFQLGWITNKGVANSLDKKLEEVKKKIKEGHLQTAGNILRSFVLDLEAQHQKEEPENEEGQKQEQEKEEEQSHKHVTDNAYYLLKPNAEFILYKLKEQEEQNQKEDEK